MDPYRSPAAIERVTPRQLVPEKETPPSRALRARAFSDGTTELRVRPTPAGRLAAMWGAVAASFGIILLLVLATAVPALQLLGGFAAPFVLILLGTAVLASRGERFLVDRNTLVHRPALPWRATEVHLLDEIGQVNLLGAEEMIWIDVGHHPGKTVEWNLHGLGAEDLDWVARRIERAIDDARRARR